MINDHFNCQIFFSKYLDELNCIELSEIESFFFLWTHPWPMDIPRLETEPKPLQWFLTLYTTAGFPRV